MATGGCAPEIMGYSPVAAVSNLLRQRGTTIADYDLVELHEAFAAQYLACEKALGQTGLATVPSPQRCESPPPSCATAAPSQPAPGLIRERTNVNGSGIGLAHPVGSSGSRMQVSAASPLRSVCVLLIILQLSVASQVLFSFFPGSGFPLAMSSSQAPDSMSCFYRELSPDKI